MSLELRVQQNTQAINDLIEQAKKISELNLFQGAFQNDDLLLFYIDATDETVAIRYQDFTSQISAFLGGDRHYLHEQGTPSAVWTITHNLNKFPSVSILDSAQNEVEGEVVYDDINTITINFNSAFSGSATLN